MLSAPFDFFNSRRYAPLLPAFFKVLGKYNSCYFEYRNNNIL